MKTRMLLVLAMSWALGWQALGQETGEPVSPDVLQASTTKLLKIWNDGKTDLIPQVFAAGYVRHDASAPQDVKGLDGIKAVVESNRAAFPDLKWTVDEQVQAGTRVLTRWTLTGTNTGDVAETMPATGRAVKVSGVTLTAYENGKIAEQWVYWDSMSMLKQLGFRLVAP